MGVSSFQVDDWVEISERYKQLVDGINAHGVIIGHFSAETSIGMLASIRNEGIAGLRR